MPATHSVGAPVNTAPLVMIGGVLMKSSNQVVLTETSIVVLSHGVFQTSIPLRQWSTRDGTTWSSALRQRHQIEWLSAKLNHVLADSTPGSIMQRVLRVLADPSMPSRLRPPLEAIKEVNPLSCDELTRPPLRIEVASPQPRRLRHRASPRSRQADVGLSARPVA